jgi:polyisoprenyl-phosphate glycosyltransferase
MINKNKEKNFVSAVIYVRNNENSISDFLSNIYQLFDDNFEKFELICVNDYSKDDSLKQIKQTCENIEGSPVSIINMGYYHGVELSMNAGVDLAIGDFVFEFDSSIIDYELKLIMDIYRHSLTGFDIVSACPNSDISKSSRLFYRLFNKNSYAKNNLKTETFRILSRRAINRVHAISKTIPYRKAIYASCGLNVSSLDYENKTVDGKRQSDESKVRQSTAIDSLMLFTNVAFKFSMIMTIIMMAVVLFMAIYSVIIFMSGTPVEGWTTTILFISFSFFGIFAILAIIIKYLSLLLNLIFKKENYFIMSIEKVTK